MAATELVHHMGNSSGYSPKHLVYLVEPHPIAAGHLSTALKRNPALAVIHSGFNLPRDAALSSRTSALIVDAGALPFPLVPYLRTVRVLFTDARILVIGERVSDDEICRLLLHGVRGFLPYDQVDEHICKAVEALLSGHTWVSPEVLERYLILSSARPGHGQPERGDLTPREREILGPLERRLSDKEIASAIGGSAHTVRFHIQNIFKKLGVHDRYSVLDWARTASLGAPEKTRKVEEG